MKVKDLPVNFRPREKALKMGFSSLNEEELLAVVLQSGVANFSVLEIAHEIIEKLGGFHNIIHANLVELSKIKGISRQKSLQLLAVIEMMKRLIKLEYEEHSCYYNADNIYQKYRFELGNSPQEVLLLVMLSSRNKILGEEILFKGTESECIISKVEILKTLLRKNATKFILIHNHPSGDSRPSQNDIETSILLKQDCSEFGIKFVDHLIITHHDCFSFKKKSLI